MNERLKELMVEAGYAFPEGATRAHELADLIINEVLSIVEPYQDARTEGFSERSNLYNSIKERFGMGTPDQCEHDWTTSKTNIVTNAKLCTKCFTINL